MKELAVIIVVYRFPKKSLKKLIKALINIGINKDCIFVKDNTTYNVGYAGAINIILRRILKKYKYFLILNPDIEIKNNFVKPLLRNIMQNEADISGPVIYTKNGNIWGSIGILDKKRYSATMLNKSSWKPNMIDFVPGTAFLVKREVFEKVGMFEEKYFLYYDEVDFCIRAKKFGFKLLVNPESKIIHYESTTVGKDSSAMRYYMARSHLYFVERFAPISIKLREFLRLPKTIWQARNRKYELYGILDYFLRRFGRNKAIHVLADEPYR